MSSNYTESHLRDRLQGTRESRCWTEIPFPLPRSRLRCWIQR